MPIIGGDDGIWTHNIRRAKTALSQLELRPQYIWSGWRNSNPQRLVPKTSALPIAPHPDNKLVPPRGNDPLWTD